MIENAVFFQFPFPGAIENAVFFQFPFPGVIENAVFFQFLFFSVYEVLCFSSSLSLSQFPSSSLPVPFPVPFPSLPSSLRGFPMFFQGKCVADVFLLKKKTFVFFS